MKNINWNALILSIAIVLGVAIIIGVIVWLDTTLILIGLFIIALMGLITMVYMLLTCR